MNNWKIKLCHETARAAAALKRPTWIHQTGLCHVRLLNIFTHSAFFLASITIYNHFISI